LVRLGDIGRQAPTTRRPDDVFLRAIIRSETGMGGPRTVAFTPSDIQGTVYPFDPPRMTKPIVRLGGIRWQTFRGRRYRIV